MSLAPVDDRDGLIRYNGAISPTPDHGARCRGAQAAAGRRPTAVRHGVYRPYVRAWTIREGKGWHDPRIIPYQPFSFDPATAVLHYAQDVFDGLKAYRGSDGVIRFFRASNMSTV